MDDILLKKLLSRLSPQAFQSFIVEYYNSQRNQKDIQLLEELGEDVFYRGLLDSYGGSLHSIFLLQHLPIELLKFPEKYLINKETLVPKLKQIRNFYKGKMGAWGMVSESLRSDCKLQSINLISNLSDVEIQIYFENLIPSFDLLIKQIFKRKTLATAIGSFDSFFDLDTAHLKKSFTNFLENNYEGIRISLSEKITVERFIVEKNLSNGVMSKSKFPYEPLFINRISQKEEILKEFESIINKNTDESELEKFLVSYYKDIFGPKYDRIETQLWLKFPDLDISNKNRRLDIFLRNSILNDWELFEVKRIIELSRNYRDVPVLSKEIAYAIHQVKNYARTLSQDSVKRYFVQQGIEYFEPSLNLVVGNKPQISQDQWRWLSSSDKDVNILTFDNLIKEMQIRLADRASFFSKK